MTEGEDYDLEIDTESGDNPIYRIRLFEDNEDLEYTIGPSDPGVFRELDDPNNSLETYSGSTATTWTTERDELIKRYLNLNGFDVSNQYNQRRVLQST
jgi:hypothetical protein